MGQPRPSGHHQELDPIFVSRRPAPDRDESGFTLVEVIVYVVLIGIIIVPLATVTTQAIRFFPTSNARSQTAANLDRLQYQFADDVAEAQLMINFALNQTASATNVWWPGIARHTSVVSGPITCARPAPALNSSTIAAVRREPGAASCACSPIRP